MTHTITLKALRPGLPKVANAIASKYDRYIVTKRGNPVMMLINPEDYEGLIETIEILSDKTALRRIKKARKEAESGKTVTLAELRRRIERV
ncbi:MAG: type II toxin-antitoxin system Phd/YefM family antitoxin [Candidatus Nanoarchaeia archaeon]|nr:type II toxin-antitoxin system Phd/YefM family antitoxin [Candidatus Omnitrophota bacterium]MDD5358608.1 type II toxin-antitoxin system Phd/YefM family antitoxin [Candidatus Nanoarchaeia archaeon]MDD5546767.1 type II toxin-antitoxin system Phd/YefM family antitoxin [Candidatus Omnitrophota bacterium]